VNGYQLSVIGVEKEKAKKRFYQEGKYPFDLSQDSIIFTGRATSFKSDLDII